jgi:hypothetical protein
MNPSGRGEINLVLEKSKHLLTTYGKLVTSLPGKK